MRIAIIGGGAAGLMAAATILETAPHAELFLIEKNNGLGKKVIISGGGRCNVTTGIQDVRTVLTKYPRGGKFLSSAIYTFPPESVYTWFEDHGVPLKTEEDLRVFPISNDGHDIVHAFERVFARHKVHTLLETQAQSVQKTATGFAIILRSNPEPLLVDALVLTTGGQAYRHTGSTGDGYAFAQALGHTITSLAPSLNAFFTRETWVSEVSGVSFERATVRALGDHPAQFTGPILFTHKGVTGPAVFALSSLVAFTSYDTQSPLAITVDIAPDVTRTAVAQELREALLAQPKKHLLTVLGLFVPKSLATIALQELTISPETHAAEVSRAQVEAISAWVKGIPLHVVARGAGDEFVTAGGVSLSEVNPSTMESRVCPNLFFAGEILDIDGFTGGFNLQASWATGRLAGLTLAERASSEAT